MGLILGLVVSLMVAGIAVAPSVLAAFGGSGGERSEASRRDQTTRSAQQRQAEVKQAYGKLPMSFEINRGQASPAVKYLARGRGYQVALTATEAILSLQTAGCAQPGQPNRDCGGKAEAASNLQSRALRLKLQNMRPVSQLEGVDLLPGKSNYLIGNDPRRWRTEIPNYARVEYAEVYPGISLAYYGTQQSLEYDFVVRPGADPRQIRMDIEGAEEIELEHNGDLAIRVAGGKVYHRNPLVYQVVGGVRRAVAGRYVLKGGHQIGFDVERYDPTQPLVIDPVIDYSTFFGGAGADEGFAIAVDSAGQAYLTGSTSSSNFNTLAALQTTNHGGRSDAFVTKIDPSGAAIIYSTYLGGSGEDSGRGITVDGAGNAYIAGITNSPNFSTRNALQPSIAGAGDDAFVTKINNSGTELLFSTYLGGSENDRGYAVTLDSAGDLFVAGSTASSNFKTQSPLQAANRGNTDAFVAKIRGNGSALLFSTYLGGRESDEAYGVTVDSLGNVYLAGATASPDFNTFNPVQAANRGGGSDAFIAKINSQGFYLEYSTYLGGSGADAAYGVDVDANFNAYLTGHTFSTDFNTFNALQPRNQGQSDAFITCLNFAGSGFIYSTYLGGRGNDFGRGIAVDANGQAYIVGRSNSTDLTVRNAVQGNNRGDFDAFVAAINSFGSDLVYSTYLGGSSEDSGYGIAIDNAGNAYVVGDTRSGDFNTFNPMQAENRGGLDAFVTKITASGFGLAYSTYLGGGGDDLGLGLALDAAGNAYLTGYTASNDLILQSPLQPVNRGGLDAFVIKLLGDGSAIAFSTYYGGSGSDTGSGIAVDGTGNCYIAGSTTSTDLPMLNPIQATNGGESDAFVAKFNAAGSGLVYATYLGGRSADLARGLAVDQTGSAVIAGGTLSTDFPVAAPFQLENRGAGDAFVARLNPGGTALVYSSYLGGTGADAATGIALDSGGNAYLVGSTASNDFNTIGALQPGNRGGQDVFVTKVNPSGAALVYSTYLGGSGTDSGNGIAVDRLGGVYVTGSTSSNDFNTLDPLQATYGGGESDAFVTKIREDGSALAYSTYLGGALAEAGLAIAVDASGDCFVTGLTASTNFPLKSAAQAEPRGGNEVFITAINAEGTDTLYSSYLGGSRDDRGYGIAVGSGGAVYVVGATSSPDFNIESPLLAYGGGTDVFITKLFLEGGFRLTPSNLELEVGATSTLTVTLDSPVTADVTVALESSNSEIVDVQGTVTIAAGTETANFIVTAKAAGGPVTVKATLPESEGGGVAISTITVKVPNRALRAASLQVSAGGTVTVPIELSASGGENRLSFSLSVDNQVLLNPQFALGKDATGALLNTALSQAPQGRYGFTILLPPGESFEVGRREVLVLTATAVSNVTQVVTSVNFADQPTLRRATDGNNHPLTISYIPGTVTVIAGLEGDVSPRPTGNGTVTTEDWMQTGLFVVGLENPVLGNELRRADTAPRASAGDGVITLSDWVQTGRYAAGLDPIVSAAGPSGPPEPPEVLSLIAPAPRADEGEQVRAVRVVTTVAVRGQQVDLTVEADTKGDENAYGFTLNFDASKLAFVNAGLGPDAGPAVLNVNSSEASAGLVGLVMALPAGQTYSTGIRKLLTLTFTVGGTDTDTALPVSFGDQRVRSEAANAKADLLPVTWTAGEVKIARSLANVSAASFLGDELARDSIVAAFGVDLAESEELATGLPLPTELGGIRVNIRDSAGAELSASLFFVGPEQINYLLPSETALGQALVTIVRGEDVISAGLINVAAVRPGLFSVDANSRGLASAVVFRKRSDGTDVFEPVSRFDPENNRNVAIPIDLGPEGDEVFLLIFGTGFRGREDLSTVNAKIGGEEVEVLYVGPQSDFVGLDQANLRLPRSLAGRGDIDLALTVDGKAANAVRVNIK
ncbi:MAG TPA: SBBP repeat-containing protein [Blastocatellia bacterium]|nr:SBBP repeat-containing protein [Blastocatellia bacterium]